MTGFETHLVSGRKWAHFRAFCTTVRHRHTLCMQSGIAAELLVISHQLRSGTVEPEIHAPVRAPRFAPINCDQKCPPTGFRNGTYSRRQRTKTEFEYRFCSSLCSPCTAPLTVNSQRKLLGIAQNCSELGKPCFFLVPVRPPVRFEGLENHRFFFWTGDN